MHITLTSIKDISIRKITKSLCKLFAAIIGAFMYITFVAVLVFKWVPPPTTSFMIQQKMKAYGKDANQKNVIYKWKDWEQISPYIKIAVIASEDQNFATHWGFDINAIKKAIDEYQEGQNLRGASTITQQVAKNLFLWPGKSFIRKGMEAYITVLLEVLWSKKRILEVYINIAQFGDHVYGAPAASEEFFNIDSANLDIFRSSLMATALPNPTRYDIGNPSDYMLERRIWVVKYMLFLGLEEHLKKIEN